MEAGDAGPAALRVGATGGTGRAVPSDAELLEGALRRARGARPKGDGELRLESMALARACDVVAELVPLAERDASRREELFGAIREAVAMSGPIGPRDAELVVLMVTVLLDAGRPVETSEVSRRIRERWGEHAGESAVYAAKSSGAIRADMYGVLYLQRPAGDGTGAGEEWMYRALEAAVGLGAARYTGSGIEMTGAAAGALTGRELAGAEAVAAGVNAHGEPPGLSECLEARRMRGGHGRKTTWAEATVAARGAEAEVGAAWARIARERALAPAAA